MSPEERQIRDSEAPRGKPRGIFARLGARFAKSRQGRRASLAELGQAGEAWAEPCDLSADLSGVALAKTEAIRAKGEAKNAIPPCGNLPAMLSAVARLQAGPQGILAKKGKKSLLKSYSQNSIRNKIRMRINASSSCHFGWLPDVPDRRDIPFRAIFRMPVKVPTRVDLRGGCSAIEQQGNLGSCTAQALTGALEFLELKTGTPLVGGRSKDPSVSLRKSLAGGHAQARPLQNVHPAVFADLSRLFVYYNEREAMGTVMEDSGAMIRTGIKVLKNSGVCRETVWPYKIARFTEKPPDNCYREAENHQVTAYQRLHTLAEMKACLTMGLPFVFGFAVYEHVMSEQVRKNGVIRLPRRNERMIGGHAVMAVGYDDAKKILLFRNSWGSEWGKSGYGSLPYDYPESRELSDDFWCIQATESNLYARWLLPRVNAETKTCELS